MILYYWKLEVVEFISFGGGRGLRSLGEGIYIVFLVKVDGVGDRRETFISVMIVFVYS